MSFLRVKMGAGDYIGPSARKKRGPQDDKGRDELSLQSAVMRVALTCAVSTSSRFPEVSYTSSTAGPLKLLPSALKEIVGMDLASTDRIGAAEQVVVYRK